MIGVFVQLIFGPMNQLYKNLNIAKLETSYLHKWWESEDNAKRVSPLFGSLGVNWCFVKERRHCLPPKSNFLMSERAEEENARVLHFFMFETIRSTSGRPANEYSLGLDKVKSGCVKLPKISCLEWPFQPSYSSADGGELHPSFMAQIYTQSLNLQARLPSLVLFTRGTLFRTSRSSK